MIQQALSVALMYAFEHGREGFVWDDLREAMANIEAGLAEPVQYTEKETLAVARHEVGHAVANRFFIPDMKSVRLSIRKRGGALGHHQAVESTDSFVRFRTRMAGEVRWGLGSIAVERVFYGENTSGVDPLAVANVASAAGVRIHTVGVGTEAGTTFQYQGFTIATALDSDVLKQMSSETNGTYHPSTDAGGLATVTKTIRLHFTLVAQHTEITGLFCAIALVILLLGALGSVRWLGRVV